LEQHVVTAAALCEVLSAGDSSAGKRHDFHDALERFYADAVDQSRALRALVADPQVGFAQGLFGADATPNLESALAQPLSRPTRRKQLTDALALAEAGEALPVDWELFQGEIGKALLQAFQSEQWKRKIKKAPVGYGGCAHDWNSFPRHEASEFQNLRIGCCINCKRFTLRLDP